MSPSHHKQRKMNVLLQMVMALITAILLGQLWLFTVTLDTMESPSSSLSIAIVAAACSLLACASVWMLIRFFLSAEQTETEDRS